MKLLLDQNGKEYLDSLLTVKQVNINIADMLNEAFLTPGMVRAKRMETLKRKFPVRDSYYSLLLEYFGIHPEDPEDSALAERWIYQGLSVEEAGKYQDDAYRKTVTPKEGEYGDYKVEYLTYSPYQLWSQDEILVDEEDYQETSRTAFFETPFSYLALSYKNTIWMSLNPNEINTMRPFIEKAKGNVLVLGLGMGYVPFMMSLKEDVKSVTIVEKDPKIIDIFKKTLFPFFPKKEKIRIVEDDAVRFLEKESLSYDYLFADLWHNPEDGLPLFLDLKRIGAEKKVRVDCWLETSLHAMMRRCMLSVLEEATLNYKENQYRQAENDFDRLINHFYFKTRDREITTREDLKMLLGDDTLEELAR